MIFLDYFTAYFKVSQLQKDLEAAKADITRLSGEVGKAQALALTRLEELSAVTIAKQEAESQVKSLQKELTSLNATLKEKGQLIADLSAQLQGGADLVRENAELKAKVRDLQAQLASLTQERDGLAAQVQSLEQKVSLLIPTCNTFAQYVKQFGKEIADSLTPAQKAALWWESEKALWVAFAKQSITPYEDWTAQQIKDAVDRAYDGRDAPHPKLEWCEFADGKYRVTTVANIRNIFVESFIGLMPYIAELHDCDDSAAEFRQHLNRHTLNSCLEVFGDSMWGYHAFNLVVCTDGIVMVEPQASGRGEADQFFKVLPKIIGQTDNWWIPRKVRDV